MHIARWVLGALVFGALMGLPKTATAQTTVGNGSPRFGGGSTAIGTPGFAGASGLPAGARIYPYSYAVTAPMPARQYVPYGSNDLFPYYGRPYGHAYEKWSWGTLSGGDPLARYYYPPVR